MKCNFCSPDTLIAETFVRSAPHTFLVSMRDGDDNTEYVRFRSMSKAVTYAKMLAECVDLEDICILDGVTGEVLEILR